jgi:hypothetical protein
MKLKNALNLNKKRFLTTLGLGFGGLTTMITAIFATGNAYAAFPITGVGGFVIAADSINGTGFKQAPTVGQTSQQQAYPMSLITLDNVTIKGLKLTKDIDVSSQFGGLISKVQIQITSSQDVTGTGVNMNVSGITADQANFGGLDIHESYSTDPTKQIQLSSTNLSLTNAQMNTHSMGATNMNMPGMSVKILGINSSGAIVTGNF